jgi:hypothetical protein
MTTKNPIAMGFFVVMLSEAKHLYPRKGFFGRASE